MKKIFCFGILTFYLLMLVSCGPNELRPANPTAPDLPPAGQAQNEKPIPPTPEELPVEEETKDAAERLLAQMSLEEKIYQMIFTTPEALTGVKTVTAAGETTREALERSPVGGVIYFAANLKNRAQTQQMIENIQSYSQIPLFIGVDEEGGTVSRLGRNPKMGVSQMPAMVEIGRTGDAQKAFEVGNTIGNEIKELGFNVDFAPVADIKTNPNNTEIGSRSFGTDPEMVKNMVAQEVRGLQESGVCAALKHFPGHGSTQANSHNGYSESTRTLDELRKTEFVPFAAGIQEGVDFVLISHMSAVNVTQDQIPCSLSKYVITGLLRGELGYQNIVITDSLQMGAITSRYGQKEAAVMAVEAGADMLLMPPDVRTACVGVREAVESGRLSEKRIDESVLRILHIKQMQGILLED